MCHSHCINQYSRNPLLSIFKHFISCGGKSKLKLSLIKSWKYIETKYYVSLVYFDWSS